MVHSFCGDDWRACRDYVRTRLGLPHGTGDRVAVKIFRSPANDDDAARRTATAFELWHRAQPIAGTPRGDLSRGQGRPLQRQGASLASERAHSDRDSATAALSA